MIIKRELSDALERARRCDGKQRWNSKHDADVQAQRLNRASRKLNCQSYPCRFCGGWHVGHKRVDP
jgi:hypothetical protein